MRNCSTCTSTMIITPSANQIPSVNMVMARRQLNLYNSNLLPLRSTAQTLGVHRISRIPLSILNVPRIVMFNLGPACNVVVNASLQSAAKETVVGLPNR